MEICRRTNTFKLYFLRLLFFLLTAAVVLLINKGRSDYGAVLVFVMGLIALVPVSAVTIWRDGFRVREYFIYGFTFKDFSYKRMEVVKISIREIELDNPIHLATADDWSDIFLVVDPDKVQIRKYQFKKIHQGKVQKISARLSAEEYDLIRERFL